MSNIKIGDRVKFYSWNPLITNPKTGYGEGIVTSVSVDKKSAKVRTDTGRNIIIDTSKLEIICNSDKIGITNVLTEDQEVLILYCYENLFKVSQLERLTGIKNNKICFLNPETSDRDKIISIDIALALYTGLHSISGIIQRENLCNKIDLSELSSFNETDIMLRMYENYLELNELSVECVDLEDKSKQNPDCDIEHLLSYEKIVILTKLCNNNRTLRIFAYTNNLCLTEHTILNLLNKAFLYGLIGPKTKTYNVPVYWQMMGYVSVEAESEEDAIELVKNNDKISLPEGSYLDDSFEVESDPSNVY